MIRPPTHTHTHDVEWGPPQGGACFLCRCEYRSPLSPHGLTSSRSQCRKVASRDAERKDAADLIKTSENRSIFLHGVERWRTGCVTSYPRCVKRQYVSTSCVAYQCRSHRCVTGVSWIRWRGAYWVRHDWRLRWTGGTLGASRVTPARDASLFTPSAR